MEADRKPGFWKSFDWKLMAALLFPVALDTLDYTGAVHSLLQTVV